MITSGTVEFTWPSSYTDNRPGAKVTLGFDLTGLTNKADAEKFIGYVGDLARLEATRLQTGEMRQEAAADPKPATRKRQNPADVVIGAPAEPTPAAAPPEPVLASSPPTTAPVATADPMGLNGASTPTSAAAISVTPTAVDVVTGGSPTSAPAVTGPATGASPSEGISNVELTTAISKKCGELQQLYPDTAVAKIVALVEEFVAKPGHSTAMSQEQRPVFLDRLKVLA